MDRRDASAFERAIGSLRATAFFRSLDDEAAERVARQLVRRRYRRNEVIFHEGDPGDRLHIIDSGRVRIVVQSEDGRDGTLAILRTGDTFGELVLLDRAPRSATAIALEATETLTLVRTAVEEFIERDPAIRQAIMAGVAEWLRRLTEQVAELHFLDLRGRLIATLVRQAREAQPDDPKMVVLPPLTQSDLATFVAGTRQRVNQTLADLQREGLITQDGKCVTVIDVERLAERTTW